MLKIKRLTLICFLLAACYLPVTPASAADVHSTDASSYTPIDLSLSCKVNMLKVHITHNQSLAHGWRAGQKIAIQAYVQDQNHQRRYIWDRQGCRLWMMTIGHSLESTLFISLASGNFTGRLTILANGEALVSPTPASSETAGCTIEKVYNHQFEDGASLKVHYTDQILAETGVNESFAKQVFEAAVIAYRTITRLQGFSTAGYSFAQPDKAYAYDPDKTIDIYLGNPIVSNAYKFHAFANQVFRDSPCFDTVKVSSTAHQAVILLPANYREFIKNWERLNPSSLGERNTGTDIRGTLIHEMLHVILFYYNKNLNRENGRPVHPDGSMTQPGTRQKNLDWYVEGLARYFETFAGARSDFFSQGFRETFPDKIRFSRGGSNYFMRYPDQTFTELRYENALFWRFIDYQFGMSAIEALSRQFRVATSDNFRESIEGATHTPFHELLQRFAMAILFKDFGLKEDAVYLKDVAKTELKFRDGSFYLIDGYNNEKFLGPVCGTDWIGRWGGARAKFGELPVAGDNTEVCDVSGWATDFYQITLDGKKPVLPDLKVVCKTEGEGLCAQLVLQTHGGSSILKRWEELPNLPPQRVNLSGMAKKEGLGPENIEKIYLLITNYDSQKNVDYEISSAL